MQVKSPTDNVMSSDKTVKNDGSKIKLFRSSPSDGDGGLRLLVVLDDTCSEAPCPLCAALPVIDLALDDQVGGQRSRVQMME